MKKNEKSKVAFDSICVLSVLKYVSTNSFRNSKFLFLSKNYFLLLRREFVETYYVYSLLYLRRFLQCTVGICRLLLCVESSIQ